MTQSEVNVAVSLVSFSQVHFNEVCVAFMPFCCVIEKLLDACRCRVDSRLATNEKSIAVCKRSFGWLKTLSIRSISALVS